MEAVITKENLLEKAILLKPIERLRLIDSLLESLDKPEPEIEKKWIEEADARYEAYRRRELKATDWEDIRIKYALDSET